MYREGKVKILRKRKDPLQQVALWGETQVHKQCVQPSSAPERLYLNAAINPTHLNSIEHT